MTRRNQGWKSVPSLRTEHALLHELSLDEVLLVLRGADDLIGMGGRTLLSKILKGSRDKRVLEHNLDSNPVYGCWQDWPPEAVMAAIDQCINRGFLRIIYSGRLPVLVFTQHGWDLERAQRIEEFLREWDQWLENGVTPVSMEYLKDRDRGMILEFLERIYATKDPRYIPFLKKWAAVDYKKVHAVINQVIKALQTET
ncbi:MAG: hypothetical protein M1294_14300 [Firmicutes bacterium]|jgi:hypothetical protein|uniref:RQC domain-containing protein n=1 Tax=Sulfobacillus benefaciens TaxID=453960 RepID=A0A2T2X0Z6_9FIRM|nr:hypothetical protein [Bacillota bacterium]MCL5015055.1 hypothetical protein [Bacillota bacterium]PSR28157.1 MAG: hypothetical protein C7B43_10570 [Sulfobacillus benefaciens]